MTRRIKDKTADLSKLSIYIPEELKKELGKMAIDQETTMSELITEMVAQCITNGRGIYSLSER